MPVVGLLSLELHFPDARSLKDKRVILRSIKDRLRKLNVAFAEVEHQELWQRSQLAVTSIGSERLTVERALHSVIDEVERKGAGVVLSSEISWLT